MRVHSIIIPVKDDAEGLQKTLHTLATQSLEATEIIVVNDGASTAISDLINALKKNFTNPLTEVKTNDCRGSYNARNKGIEASAGTKLFFIDAGILPEDGWFSKFSKGLDEADYVGGTVKIVQVGNETLGQKFHRHTAFPMAEYLEKLHFSGAGFLGVRREVVKKIGNFNHKLYSGGDQEFGKRVKQAGYRQKFLRTATAWHHPKSFKQQYMRHLRVFAGLNNLYEIDPHQFRDYRPSVLRPIKDGWYYIYTLLHFRKNSLYTSGDFTFAEFFSAQTIHYFQIIKARIKTLILSNKKYNT